MRLLALCALLLVGCPAEPAQIEACRKACAPRPMVFANALKCDCGEAAGAAPAKTAHASAGPCKEATGHDIWAPHDYGADPVVGVCWRYIDRGAVPVPCDRVLSMPEFAAVRDCPAFRTDGGAP